MRLAFFSRFRELLIFIITVAIITVMLGTLYAAVQQNYRSDANNPQIEAAETITEIVNQGAPAEAIIGQSPSVDIANSLSVFVMIFDKDAKLIGSSGVLGEDTPNPPSGVFNSVKQNGEERFTWEPKEGVRIASVMKKIGDDKGFVLVGKNLRETELQVRNLTLMVGISWAVLTVLALLLMAILKLAAKGLRIVEETEIVAIGDNRDRS